MGTALYFNIAKKYICKKLGLHCVLPLNLMGSSGMGAVTIKSISCYTDEVPRKEHALATYMKLYIYI